MRLFGRAPEQQQGTVKVRAVVQAEVPVEIAERLVARNTDFTQSVFLEDWTYRVQGVLLWERV